MGIILIIIGLFLLSHMIGNIFPQYEQSPEEGAYFYFLNHKYFPDYTGIHFQTLDSGVFTVFSIQTGNTYNDKCIRICNISLIWGTGK